MHVFDVQKVSPVVKSVCLLALKVKDICVRRFTGQGSDHWPVLSSRPPAEAAHLESESKRASLSHPPGFLLLTSVPVCEVL